MNKLETVSYVEYEADLPTTGKHIVGSQTDKGIIVYQAYRPSIANFAIENQYFGGDFKLSRMSWIKTNFLWMMHRSGWASKSGQEHVLAIEISRDGFREILKNAIISSFDNKKYENQGQWKEALEASLVRLQWDPDHDPFGNKLERKAIQLGLKGDMLQKYSKEWIISIQDISEFVKEQRLNVTAERIDQLQVVRERVIELEFDPHELG